MDERLTLRLFQSGAVPFCCFGASLCLVAYTTVWAATAYKWAKAAPNISRDMAAHAATTGTGAVIAGAVGIEACHDWLSHRKAASLEDVTRGLVQRRAFFLRTPVLLAGTASAAATIYTFGGFQIRQPTKITPPPTQ
eukprot:m.21671 g.21671  ORF g.21671 m.21671 type:complete len:137 (-) comp5718_c0_seq1:1332-1742(-)